MKNDDEFSQDHVFVQLFMFSVKKVLFGLLLRSQADQFFPQYN